MEQFLSERGLELSHEKTRSTHIEDGFDFLGQTIRRHRNGKILIKPSKRSVTTFLTKIQETIDTSGSMTVGDMIWRLNQQIKGWTMYHRFAVSKCIFAAVDNCIFWKLRRWCRKRHRKKSWGWIRKKYFQRAGDRDWAFTGLIRDSKGKRWPIRLMQAGGVKVFRWQKIQSDTNPYDPGWEAYLEGRMAWKMGHTLAGRSRIEYLWKGQDGKCPVCRQPLPAEELPWHLHHRVWRCYGGQPTWDNLELLHVNCHRQIHARKGYGWAKPRPARGVTEDLSRRKRKFHVRFLGGGGGVSRPRYPTGEARHVRLDAQVGRHGQAAFNSRQRQ